jgi:hypothetical protein
MAMLALSALHLKSAAPTVSWKQAKPPLITRWAADVKPTGPHPEYPRPQLVRTDWLNLNGLWDYTITPARSTPPSNYTAQILVPFAIDCALSGVMQPLQETDTLWYRRSVTIPSSWRGRRIRLHFGAVDWEARVLVNGNEAGQHRGGYSHFSFDITDNLRWDRPEQIVVAVADPTEGDQPRGKQSRKPEGIFYTPTSGIWQTVWLEPVPAVCIDGLKTQPDVDNKSLHLRVAVTSLSEQLRIEAVALTDSKECGRVVGLPNSELILPLNELHLWSADNPHLYELKASLKDGDKVLDSVSSYFGMRKIALARDDQGFTRMTLNNEFLFQLGTLDQGFWPDGIYTAPTDEALRSDIEFLKKAGFNLARKHVKVEPDRWYYWCDKLGLLVWQDIPSGNNATLDGRRNFETELLRIIEDLHDHPSIIVWVLFNEGWGQYDTERLARWFKVLDPSRLIDNASGWTDMGAGDLIDVHSYPGPDARPPDSHRATVLGEFGGLGLEIQGHSWSQRAWGYLMLQDRDELAERYTRLFKQIWALHKLRGLSAAVYTQTADVETECNGLLTYDRAITKIDPKILLLANRGTFPETGRKPILADALLGGAPWRYTFEKPAPDWFKPEFNASSWKLGNSGFGTTGTPGSFPNTEWRTPHIWLRAQFVLSSNDLPAIKLRVYHDEDAEIYLNGVLALSLKGFTTEYNEYDLSPEATAALKTGTNTLAVSCHQTSGGQGIDVGVLALQHDGSAGDRKEKPNGSH